MSRTDTPQKKPVTPEQVAKVMAHAVATGDFVNFRFIFAPFSPLRNDSTESLDHPKYAYLLPDNEKNSVFEQALAVVSSPEVLNHVMAQLEKKGPAQYPWQPLLLLADNAVRLGKFTMASQAYELLRIRRRMQELYLEMGDEAIRQGNVSRGVLAYRVACGLDYDYAAFPEPLPAVPNYQHTALILHGDFPETPEQALPLRPEPELVRTGLVYLSGNAEIAGRLDAFDHEIRRAVLAEWIRTADGAWSDFAARYREAIRMVDAYNRRVREIIENVGPHAVEMALDPETARLPIQAQVLLSGRTDEHQEWWQCLKELAATHPGGALFVTRAVVAGNREVLLPCYRSDSPLAEMVGLADTKVETRAVV